MEPPATADAMWRAAEEGDVPELRRLLAADPGLALTTDSDGRTPLWCAADTRDEDTVRLLLEAAPAVVLTADGAGKLPLHAAAGRSAEAVRLLLEAAPAAALAADAEGRLPLHWAALGGNAEAVRLLLEAAPAAALKADAECQLPLEVALHYSYYNLPKCMKTARVLLPATPPDDALSALEEAGEAALPLFADLAACAALSPAQWQRVPAPCPGLGAALPAVLARSAAEAALLVGRLPAEARQRLRAGALCLVRAQREHGTELPAALVGQVLALAAGT